MVEKECKLDCPISPKGGKPYCCGKCYNSRRYFVTDSNRHLWTDENGFWSETGCRLDRRDMPDECLTYDCHEHTFIGIIAYIDGWRAMEVVELESEDIAPIKMAVNMTIDGLRKRRGNSG